MTTSPSVALDAFQQTAVAHGDGPAIVLAGPGSGKTHVIVERAVRLIDDGLARPEQLLVLTFSRKAASDLRRRLADRLRRSYASFPVTTFHAFCLSVLARNATDPPRLARPAERERAIRHALAAEGNLGLPASRALVAEALAFCSLCDDYLEIPDHALAPVRERYLRELHALDYGGLQREAVRLLREDEDLRRAYADGFRFVLVDEYQDTNVAQDRLLHLIAGGHRDVFVVADEDQSIYGFRGAEIENALRFEESWPGAKRYPLPTNYRSASGIVDLAASVIRRNVDTHREKELKPATDRRATLVGQTFRHAAEEADWIAREIAALRLDGLELGEVAILARSLKEIGPRLAYALRRHDIPFHAPLAQPMHPTVDALLSLIELALPDRWDTADEESALRTLSSPLFGADPLTLRPHVRAERTVYGSLRDSGEFDALFEALGIVKRQRNAGVAIYALWERVGYFRALQERCRTPAPLQQDVEELAAVTAFSDAANEFDGSLADFAAAFRGGELERVEWLPAGALPRDAVALLTVHQAKGLEWDAVFVCDLVEGRFPALARSEYALFDRADFARAPLSEAERARRALEEERRLFYVAMTRARSRLALTATEESREEAGRSLSRFFLEAQDHLGTEADTSRLVSVEEALAALRRAGGGEPGWRERQETVNASPMLPGPLRASATWISPYEDCPLQFYYGSLLELVRATGESLVFGRVVHDVLEAFHDTEHAEPRSIERLLELAGEHWEEREIRPRPLEVEFRRLLNRLLTGYFELEVAAGKVGHVLAVERRFAVPVGDVTLSGRIDRIDRLDDGGLRLLDYKSSKSAMAAKDAEEDLQLALYAVACALDDELHALGDVREIVYLYPRHIARGELARRSQTVTPDLVDRTRDRVTGLVSEIRAERFDFSPEADCRFCQFKSLCPRHDGGDVAL